MIKKQAEIDKKKERENADLEVVSDEEVAEPEGAKSNKKSTSKNYRKMNETFEKKDPSEELTKRKVPFGHGYYVVSPVKPKGEKMAATLPVKKQLFTLDGLPVKNKKKLLARIGGDPLGGLEEDQFSRLEEDEKELVLDSML